MQNELWMSLADYEKQLKEQMTGYELKLFLAKNQAMDREEALKTKCAYRLDLYEIALRELKLKSTRDIEHAMMA